MNNSNGVNIYKMLFWGWVILSFNIYLGQINILFSSVGIFIIYSNLIETMEDSWKKKYFMISAYSAGILCLPELLKSAVGYITLNVPLFNFISIAARLMFTVMTMEIVKDNLVKWVNENNLVWDKAYSESTWKLYQKTYVIIDTLTILLLLMTQYDPEFFATFVVSGLIRLIVNILVLSSFWNLYKTTQKVKIDRKNAVGSKNR